MMTLKMKIYRERMKLFFTKRRYTGNHPKWQKRILICFLLMVNAFIWTVDIHLLPDMRITFGESRMVFVNEASAYGGARKEPEKALHEGASTGTTGAVAGEEPKGISLERKILDAFPEDGMNALLVAKCESQLSTDRIGDTNRVFASDGELIGDSVGLFQIRTGGKENGKVWNRAKSLGMSSAEYREKLKVVDYNISEARKIYDQSGKNWSRWTCGKNI